MSELYRAGINALVWLEKNEDGNVAVTRDLRKALSNYAAPVSAKREWVELTDDEIFDAYTSDAHENTPKSFARAVVAAFKEKNK